MREEEARRLLVAAREALGDRPWGVGLLDDQAYAVGCALAFAAGAFLCISLGDLLPEVHFHSHDRVKLTVMFLVGIGLAWGLRFVEPSADHGIVHLPTGVGP